MTPPELIASVSSGILSELVCVAHYKRALTRPDMSVGLRLEILEWLTRCARDLLLATVEAVEPASDRLEEAFIKARRINPADLECFFSVIERPDVFADLCKLHPSLLMALEVHKAR